MPKKYGVARVRDLPKFETTYSRSLQQVYMDEVAKILSSIADVTNDHEMIATLSEQVQQLRELWEEDSRVAAMEPEERSPAPQEPVNEEEPRAAMVTGGYRDSAFVALAKVDLSEEAPKTTWLSRKLRILVSWLES